jgi:hypothetical protein
MNKLNKTLFGLILLSSITFNSCNKEYSDYSNMEVVENSFTGIVDITSSGQDPAGDFTGEEKSGTYSFAWENNKKKAALNFDITTSGNGTVQMIINDAKGDEVLNQTRPNDENDTFAGVTQEGKKGTWLITIKLTNINGDGSFSIHPAD